MAVKNRADLQISIDTNLPDNTTEAITPATHRAVEEDLKDSNYNLLDNEATDVTYNPTTGTDWVDPDPTEVGGALDDLAGRVTTIENEPNQTAVQTPYSPTTVADWNPEEPTGPTEVGGALDILAARTGQNLSPDIAYVSVNGVDTEGVLGNPLKPFENIQAAINAVGNNSIVKVLGGTYNETLTIATKTNFLLDIGGCILNGVIVLNGCDSVSINLLNATITNTANSRTLDINTSPNTKITGGKIINTNVGTNSYCINDASNSFFYDVEFSSQYRNTLDVANCNFYNCKFDSVSSCIYRANNCLFSNCIVESSTTAPLICQNNPNIFKHCELKGSSLCVSAETTTQGYFYNTRLEGVSNNCIRVIGTSAELFFKDCDLIGGANCVEYQGSTARAATTNHVFQNCKLYAGSGNIFSEPTYSGSDLGNTQVVNCVYNKAFTPAVGPQKIFESNKIEITGLQEPLK